MCTLTVRGNSFHKQRHSCPHSFSPGFFHSLLASLFFPFFFFLYQHHCSVQRREIWSKKPQRLEESIRQCPARGGNTDVGKIRINEPWILDPCRQGPASGGSAEGTSTHTVRATPPVFKKSAIHHLTPSITVTRPLKSTWDCERQLHDTGELR